MLLMGLCVLVLAGFVRPWWLPVSLTVIALADFAPRAGYVASTYSLFDGLNVVQNAAGTSPAWGTDGQAFSAILVRTLILSVWALALLALVLARRALNELAVAGILAFTPFFMLLANSYGGEAIYRVWLFSAPWAAYILAYSVLNLRLPARLSQRMPRLPGARTAVGTVALVVMTVAMIQGAHGQIEVDYNTPSELEASRYLYATAPAGSTFMLAASSFPARSTAAYNDLNIDYGGDPDLINELHLTEHATLGPAVLPILRERVAAGGGPEQFFVISAGMAKYAHYFGYLADGSLDRLTSELRASPDWTVYYSNADTVIFRLVAPSGGH
jgi:hypothetical protein